MKSTKPAKPETKAKATRKSTAAENAKNAVTEAEAPVAVKQAHGTSRPVMSLPPPTGQPPKVPGKNARTADTAASRYTTVGKPDSSKQV